MKSNTTLLPLALVAIFFLAGILVLYIPSFDGVEQTQKQDLGRINIKEYSYKLSSEKPEAVLYDLQGQTRSEKTNTELTVYNTNLGLVKEYRTLDLKSGLNLVKYQDVASQINATSVLFEDLDYSDTFVVEQNYEYDIVSKNKLLEKYLDKQITIYVEENNEQKRYSGKLLSYTDGVLIDTADGVVSINDIKRIQFSELPEGLLTKPTLVWKIYTENEGHRNTQTTYLTNGIEWQADYVAKINENDNQMNFKGWVTVDNKTGTSYPNTSLKLVAGDVHIVTPTYPMPMYDEAAMYVESRVAGYAPKQFEEESLFEYHMYTLDRTTDIKNNETKQISLLAADNVQVTKEFVFDGQMSDKVEVKIKFENKDETGIGVPLPKGTVRVYKEDSQKKLQFLGEDTIDHTPKEEEVELKIGNAFDIVGERKQTSYQELTKEIRHTSYEIELKNRKDEAVTVKVVEHLYGDWRIITSSDNYDKKDSNTIEFFVTIPANSEKKVTYTVENINFY